METVAITCNKPAALSIQTNTHRVDNDSYSLKQLKLQEGGRFHTHLAFSVLGGSLLKKKKKKKKKIAAQVSATPQLNFMRTDKTPPHQVLWEKKPNISLTHI